MVARVQINKSDLRLEALPSATRKAFLYCSNLDLFQKNDWYLAGGTALTLQMGHRKSVDLDFFTTKNKVNELEVETTLQQTGRWQTTYREAGTIYGLIDGAKISLITYPFFVPKQKKLSFGTLDILQSADVAVMKVIAISQRGRKRDFFDLYWYCKNTEPLIDVIHRVGKQYAGQAENMNHILKSFVYFDDAEEDPDPKIYFQATWRQVKTFFRTEAVRLAKIY
ncbi:MAG: nucleotidyl transferase AbiEii/AbiGii toxin family protein [Patescibacteria group bacterium]